MANLVPVAAGGNWSSTETWHNADTNAAHGAVPVLGTDDVYLGSAGTNPTITNIAAAASGATTITLTFTGTARRGMAIKIAGTTGVYILLAQATSGSAVSITPVLEAAVTAASAVTPFNCGTVTIDNTAATCGTGKALTTTNGGGSVIVGGGATLQHAKNANTKLRVRGSIMVCPAGIYDCGTTAAPIQAANTAEVEVNATASPVIGAHCFKIGCTNARVANGDSTKVTFVHATTRKRNAMLTGGVIATATSATVHDTTGWTSTDVVGFMPTRTNGAVSNNNTDFETKTLTSLSSNTLGWSGGLVAPHNLGGHVGNFSSGVTLNGVSSSQGFGVHVDILATCNDLFFEVENARLDFGGSWTQDASFGGASVSIVYNSNPTSTSRNLRILNSGWSNTQRTAVTIAGGRVKANTIEGCAFFGGGDRSTFFLGNSCGGTIVSDCSIYRNSVAHGPTFGFGTTGNIFSRCVIATGASNNPAFNLTDGSGDIFNDCVFVVAQYAVTANNVAQATFNRCYFGVNHPTYGGGGGGFTTSTLNINAFGSLGNYGFNDCVFASDPVVASQTANMNRNSLVNTFSFLNYNADANQQRETLFSGDFYRDNTAPSTYGLRSRSALRGEPKLANTAHTKSFLVAASAGVASTFRFGLVYDTTYGVATPPSVTVSGLGITPVVFTAGASADTVYRQTVSVTPVTSGNLTVMATGQSAATTGKFWFSGMTTSPWIDWTQHYGYRYAPGSPTLTVDPIVQLSEAAAAALTGISFASNTLTLTSDKTAREIYDWVKWHEATNRLDPIITSSDGVNFALAANLVQNGGNITGTGRITLATTRTHTPNSNTSDVIIAADAGVTGIITLSVPAASSVVIYKTDGSRDSFTSSSGTTVLSRVPAGATGSRTYKVAKLGKLTVSGSILVTGGGYINVSASLVDETAVTQTNAATVAAYTALDTPDKLYDYAAYYETTSVGIDYARPVAKSGSVLDFGSRALTIDATAASVYAYTGTGVAAKAAAINQGTSMTSVLTTGNITLLNGAVAGTAPLVALNGHSEYLSLLGLTDSAVYVRTNTGTLHNYTASVTGTYNSIIPFGSTGTWTWAVKRKGYRHALGNFDAASGDFVVATPATPQKLNADGTVMYTATASALTAISFAGTTQANIDISNGTASPQVVLDESEDALVTQAGMAWLASGKSDISIFNSAGGDYVFLSTAWRLRRALAGDVNATLNAFAIGADGTVVDGVNGGVQFLTSDSPTAIAAAVWAHVTRTITGGLTLAEIEASLILAKESTVASRLSAAAYTVPPTVGAIQAGLATAAAVAAIPTTPLLASNYTAPANADIAAIKAKTDNLPADPASNTQVNTRLASSAYVAPDNAASQAAASLSSGLAERLTETRANRLDNLVNLDALVSSRLASTGYTAPPSAAAIRAEIEAGAVAKEATLNTVANNVTAAATSAAMAYNAVVDLGAPMQASAYVAPANADIAAIKAKTDNIPVNTAASLSVINVGVQKASKLIPHSTGL